MGFLKGIGKFILFIVFGGIFLTIGFTLSEQSSQTLGFPALSTHWALILPFMIVVLFVNLLSKFNSVLQNASRLKRGIISFSLYLVLGGGPSGLLYLNDKRATQAPFYATGTVEEVKVYNKQGKKNRRQNRKETSVKVSLAVDGKLYKTVLYKAGNRQAEYEGKEVDFTVQEGYFGWYIIRKSEFLRSSGNW